MNRRHLLAAAAGTAGLVAATQGHAATEATASRTFVLVHGAWHGGWCWTRVAERLRAAGHKAHVPTLTGMGERKHLISPQVSLDTHISDVLGVIEAEELSDVILVGHSYAGTIIAGVADRMPARLKQLIFLDAQIMQSGFSLFSALSTVDIEMRLKSIQENGGGVGSAPLPAAVFGVTDPGDAAWVTRRMTLQPVGTYTQIFMLKHPLGNGVPKTYIECTVSPIPSLEVFKERVRGNHDWAVRTLASGHDAMIISPGPLSSMLLELAA